MRPCVEGLAHNDWLSTAGRVIARASLPTFNVPKKNTAKSTLCPTDKLSRTRRIILAGFPLSPPPKLNRAVYGLACSTVPIPKPYVLPALSPRAHLTNGGSLNASTFERRALPASTMLESHTSTHQYRGPAAPWCSSACRTVAGHWHLDHSLRCWLRSQSSIVP